MTKHGFAERFHTSGVLPRSRKQLKPQLARPKMAAVLADCKDKRGTASRAFMRASVSVIAKSLACQDTQ